jgi:hypothetical protein
MGIKIATMIGETAGFWLQVYDFCSTIIAAGIIFDSQIPFWRSSQNE